VNPRESQPLSGLVLVAHSPCGSEPHQSLVVPSDIKAKNSDNAPKSEFVGQQTTGFLKVTVRVGVRRAGGDP
jgi:hypothetical protein